MNTSTLELIGNTPSILLKNISSQYDNVKIHAKIESFNPGGCVKERIALAIIESMEKKKRIQPGDTIIEATSGNTGIGLALVCACKPYNLVLCMPDTMSMERRQILEAYGARLELTPGSQGMKGAITRAKELAEKHHWHEALQFSNPANPEIHRTSTAVEILSQMPELDYFVAGVGTGGTITGVGEVLKKHYPSIRIIAVEPSSSPVLSGGQPGPHKIQGIGAGFIPEVLNTKILDSVSTVSEQEAIKGARLLAQSEGILCGISSGAALAACLKIASQNKNITIGTLLPDTGERYLSTGIFKSE
jgi:cysteine synthase A